ncbi:MAG: hypothetical protein H6977_05730 [Gammaproteobacteria bacterium]|nr:hypothetical protein [Gammaproteobacteria bacterium]
MNPIDYYRALEPYIISYGGTGRAAFLVGVLAFWFAFFAPRKWLKRARYRLLVALLLLVGGIALIYQETFTIARQAKYLCEHEAGVKIFRTVRAPGLLGLGGIVSWVQYGFEYAELQTVMNGKLRAERVLDKATGKRSIKEYRVEEFISEYEYGSEWLSTPACCSGRRNFVRVRKTGEILGQEVMIWIRRPHIDRLFAPIVEEAPIRCYGPGRPGTQVVPTMRTDDFVKAVLVPTSYAGDGEP